MCRSNLDHAELYSRPKYRDRLDVRSFRLRLSAAGAALPETLTLVYLPRAGGPAFAALDRVRSEEGTAAVVFASSDRVRAAEGVRFEAYVGAEAAVRGVFRKNGPEWRMECRSGEAAGVSGKAEVSVSASGGVVLNDTVELEKRRRRRKKFCSKLAEIPEEGEESECCCCCDFSEEEEEWEVVGGGEEEEGLEMEGVKWAVDMGIWAVCVGVGLLVSRASYKGFKRKFSF